MSDATETVTLTRAEYEALIERLEEAEDLAAIAAAEAREAALGKERARETMTAERQFDSLAPRPKARREGQLP